MLAVVARDRVASLDTDVAWRAGVGDRDASRAAATVREPKGMGSGASP